MPHKLLIFAYSLVNNNYSDTWIEGIGSVHGSIYSGGYFDSTEYQLLCFEQSNTLWYINSPNGECYYQQTISSVYEEFENYNIRVFPNPFTDNFNIASDMPLNKIQKAEVFTIQGVKVFDINLHGLTTKISEVSVQLNPGIYFLKIQRDRFSKVFKIIKI
ncbi:MAG: T9SS type A sorting domain-containing protein [Bacteroidota bacterium]|nr:T9SS type A sorting domain-containing protein [Bacteroidota bacterium]